MSAVVTSVHTYIRHKFRSDRIPQKKIQDVVGGKKKAENSVVIEPGRRHINGTQYKLVESNLGHKCCNGIWLKWTARYVGPKVGLDSLEPG